MNLPRESNIRAPAGAEGQYNELHGGLIEKRLRPFLVHEKQSFVLQWYRSTSPHQILLIDWNCLLALLQTGTLVCCFAQHHFNQGRTSNEQRL